MNQDFENMITIQEKYKSIKNNILALSKIANKNQIEKAIFNMINDIYENIDINDNFEVIDIDENKIDENKDENKIDENKIDENKIDENKIDENKIDENKRNDKKLKCVKCGNTRARYISICCNNQICRCCVENITNCPICKVPKIEIPKKKRAMKTKKIIKIDDKNDYDYENMTNNIINNEKSPRHDIINEEFVEFTKIFLKLEKIIFDNKKDIYNIKASCKDNQIFNLQINIIDNKLKIKNLYELIKNDIYNISFTVDKYEFKNNINDILNDIYEEKFYITKSCVDFHNYRTKCKFYEGSLCKSYYIPIERRFRDDFEEGKFGILYSKQNDSRNNIYNDYRRQTIALKNLFRLAKPEENKPYKIYKTIAICDDKRPIITNKRACCYKNEHTCYCKIFRCRMKCEFNQRADIDEEQDFEFMIIVSQFDPEFKNINDICEENTDLKMIIENEKTERHQLEGRIEYEMDNIYDDINDELACHGSEYDILLSDKSDTCIVCMESTFNYMRCCNAHICIECRYKLGQCCNCRAIYNRAMYVICKREIINDNINYETERLRENQERRPVDNRTYDDYVEGIDRARSQAEQQLADYNETLSINRCEIGEALIELMNIISYGLSVDEFYKTSDRGAYPYYLKRKDKKIYGHRVMSIVKKYLINNFKGQNNILKIIMTSGKTITGSGYPLSNFFRNTIHADSAKTADAIFSCIS